LADLPNELLACPEVPRRPLARWPRPVRRYANDRERHLPRGEARPS